MRILYITPAFQHPTVRGPHRHYHFIRSLSKRHRITLLTLLRYPATPVALKEMESMTESMLTFNVNGESDCALAQRLQKFPVFGKKLAEKAKLMDGLRRMKSAFRNLAEREAFDVVLFHGKSVYEVIRDWDGLPLVVDFCDASSMRIRSRMSVAAYTRLPTLWYRWLKMRHIERELIKRTPHVAFISNRDKEACVSAQAECEIIPIGVDHQYWQRSRNEYDPNTIVFTGVMDYGPNHDSAIYLLDRIVPAIRTKVPDLKVIIAGRDPRPELVRRAENQEGVTVTGFVEDMRVYLEKAAVFVAPLRFASGIQNKVLEAMAMELPVITTAVVADGLKLDRIPPPVKIADSAEAFGDRVVELLQDSEERSQLALMSREFVEEHFDWERSAQKLENMCLEAVNGSISAQRFEPTLSNV